MIVAYDLDGNIGKNGGMPWPHLKADMAHFNTNTTAGIKPAVLMGRKTWESLPVRSRPLPNRLNIVVSTSIQGDDCGVVKSVEEGFAVARMNNIDTLWVIGGATVYETVLNMNTFVSHILVTEIEARFGGCDVQFPKALLYRRYHLEDERKVKTESFDFTFQTFILNDY